jgi:glycosyltransferase involved in cell wall biosynthesis
MKIAVCITTRNRPDAFAKSYQQIKKYMPVGDARIQSKLFVVDDASDEPYADADFRFDERAGIARAKNKCLELSMKWGANHIFLFDDDCYPKKDGWWIDYVYHNEPHLMYIFTSYGGQKRLVNELYRDDKTVVYDHVRGCMLYYDRKCIETVGGFDPVFGHGYFEHRNLTERIHNAGLTTHLIMDVPNSHELIHSMDEWEEVKSTFTPEEHAKLLATNRRLNRMRKRGYVPYE